MAHAAAKAATKNLTIVDDDLIRPLIKRRRHSIPIEADYSAG